MDLDFRFNSSLDERVIPLFNEVATASRSKYNDLISSASAPILNNVDWWCENTSSRNTYASPLFHYVCSIELFKEILRKNAFQIEKVIVDSKALLKVFEILIEKSSIETIPIVYSKETSKRLKDSLKFLYYEWFFFLRVCRKLISMLVPRSQSYLNSAKPLILIDTFITSSYITEDRWYGSFWESVNEKTKEEIFFVPTMVDKGLINFYRIISGIRYSSKNYILKEDFLSLRDFLEVYKHKYRLKNVNVGTSFLGEVDLTKLVRECLLSNRDVHSTMESLLTYLFLKNLSNENITVRLSIDWFEGHSVDKMWNLGIHDFFPNTKRIAYETFRSFPYYLSIYPIPIEIESHTVPNTFAVQGPACAESVKEFLPDLRVVSVPAFKNQHVWKDQDKINAKNNTVLVAFPISLNTSLGMLESLIKNSERNKSLEVSYILKPHPVNKIKDIKSKLSVDMPPWFKFTSEKSFPILLEECSMLITEASSVCLESFAVGKPVIILENITGLTYDPVPKDIPPQLFRKCRTAEEVKFALQHFLKLSDGQLQEIKDLGIEIRNKYFEKFSLEGLNRFLDI